MANNNALNREREAYTKKHAKSKTMQAEAAKYLPGGSSRGTAYFDPYPFFVDHAEGHYVYDVDGNRYLDFMINATTYIVGHANPKVVKAVTDQAPKGLSYSAPTDVQVRLAKLLVERVPSVEKIRFTNSGTEGTMNAIRMARAFTGKPKYAKFEGGYHGNSEEVSISVSPPLSKLDPNGYNPVPEWPGQPPGVTNDVVIMPYNNLEACEDILRRHQHEVGCVIMEAVLSNIGYVPGKPEFLQGMRDLTKELGMVLIFDEVQTLRLAPGGAQEMFGVIPDVTCFGKIIGGGLPVGAWGGRDDLMALYDNQKGATISHPGTFNANPMTMAAGEATMTQLTPPVYKRLNALGDSLRAKLRATFDELDVPAQVTGVGSLFGIHFNEHEITDYRSYLKGDKAKLNAFYVGMMNEGILMFAKGIGALNINTTEKEIDQFVTAARKVVQRIR
ncbi:MAG: aspartate aminotransferase family protein [SAR202 cluster bacterium]|nr:aspartate aminotransferase family protein [SAR202 cluster bacterium]